MKKYELLMKANSYLYVEVEAENEEDSINKAKENVIDNFQNRALSINIEPIEVHEIKEATIAGVPDE